MRGSQTIRRAGFALLSCIALLSACEFGTKRPQRSEHSRAALPQLSAEPEPKNAAPMASAIGQTLRSVHDQKLDISAPSTPRQLLEFGVGRLLQASGSKAVFRDTKQGDVVSEASLAGVFAVAHGSDGALFALGASLGTRLEARASSRRDFPHVAFFPGSLLFPDLESPDHFYVYYPGEQKLYSYLFQSEAGAFMPIEASYPLEGCTSALALLRDGGFVCRTAHGFLRKAPRGRRAEFKSASEAPDPVRLLPAKRLDELFAVDQAGEVRHLRLAAGMPLLGRFHLPAPPYAAAANGEALAFILVTPPGLGEGRRWSLLVTDLDGAPRFRTELPGRSAPADEDWLKTVVEDKNLAISGFASLVAVGGAAQVSVWNYAEGQPVFSR